MPSIIENITDMVEKPPPSPQKNTIKKRVKLKKPACDANQVFFFIWP
jgi:hypothetical protein